MQYFVIDLRGKTLVGGPYINWQAACLAEFGLIDREMHIKPLGNNQYYVRKKSWLNAKLAETSGWFSPYIIDSALGVALSADGVMGPFEIGKTVIEYGEKFKNCTYKEQVERLYGEVLDRGYLRYVSLKLAELFSKHYNHYLATLPQEPVPCE